MNDLKTDAPKANLLVVDDTPVNLQLLSKILTKQGYFATTASSGPTALNTVQTKPPDLILLDVMMPDMDGYEVCKQLKAEARTRDIPIIFLSASHQTQDKVKAFAVGGVDYITKPFQSAEVWARVETHLALRHMQKHLQEKNDQLYNEIVERRKAETALQQSNNRYSNLAQSIPAMIYQYVLYPDGSQKFLYVSPACRQVYGLEPEAMVENGVLINQNVHLDDSNALEKSLAAAVN